MANYSEFQESPINKLMNKFCYFFVVNIYFILCNMLLILASNLFEVKLNNILIFFIAFIPTGSSLGGLFHFMNKVNDTNGISGSKEYFIGYIKNFKDSMRLWLLILTLTTILIADLVICFQNSKFLILIIPTILMILFILIIGSYSMPILCRYKISLWNNIKLSLHLIFKKPIVTIANLTILVLWIALLLINNLFFVFFASSICSFLLAKNLRSIYEYIERIYLL